MGNGLKAVEEMSIEELRAEVKVLRTKSVYYLETGDFASVLDEDDVKEVVLYTEEELNYDELQEATYTALRAESFSIDDWSEYVAEYLPIFSSETIRLLATLKHRCFSEE